MLWLYNANNTTAPQVASYISTEYPQQWGVFTVEKRSPNFIWQDLLSILLCRSYSLRCNPGHLLAVFKIVGKQITVISCDSIPIPDSAQIQRPEAKENVPTPPQQTVIVLDLLDTFADNSAGKSQLISWIATNFEKFPDGVRLVISTQWEEEICTLFRHATIKFINVQDPRESLVQVGGRLSRIHEQVSQCDLGNDNQVCLGCLNNLERDL